MVNFKTIDIGGIFKYDNVLLYKRSTRTACKVDTPAYVAPFRSLDKVENMHNKPITGYYNDLHGSTLFETLSNITSAHYSHNLFPYMGYGSTRVIYTMYTNADGKVHRDNEPAIIIQDTISNETLYVYAQNGTVHRLNKPAAYDSTGTRMLFAINGKVHRDGGPALCYTHESDQIEVYYKFGRLHRDDGPAYVSNDCLRWFQYGDEHRTDGPACIYDGRQTYWSRHGTYHREDGPAKITADGDKFWYQHSKLHRLDGPAVEYANGQTEFWAYDMQFGSMLELAVYFDSGDNN